MIHETSIQDNFITKKIVTEEKYLPSDKTTNEVINNPIKTLPHQQSVSTIDSKENLKDSNVSTSEYSWSHFDTKDSKVNLPQTQIYNDELQLLPKLTKEITKRFNDKLCDFKCKYLLENLSVKECEVDQGQNSHSLKEYKKFPENNLNVQLSLKAVINPWNRTTVQKFFLTDINYKKVHSDINNELNLKNIDIKKALESKFEASVRLKRLEERINKYKVNKVIPIEINNRKEKSFIENGGNIRKPSTIRFDSSDVHINDGENEDQTHTTSQSRVDSCIDFLNFFEKGEIASTPELNVTKSLFNNTNVSNTDIFELSKKVEDNEINSYDFKIEKNQIINHADSEPCNISEKIKESNEIHTQGCLFDDLEDKKKQQFENIKKSNEIVFHNIQNVLEESLSDSEICHIFFKEAVDLSNLENGELSQNISKSDLRRTESLTPELIPADSYTHCEFSANNFACFNHFLSSNLHECYDELTEDFEEDIIKLKEGENPNSENFCECSLEAIPLYNCTSKMRETSMGPIRGLLKKPNRPPASRKNRVVFDETKNQFFDADYIILIREDCLYDDEEDTEPCTCGEHELVRICCDEGCCGYGTDDGRTPPVSIKFKRSLLR